MELAKRKSPKKYSHAIGNGLGDAGQGLLGFQVSENQPSLYGYFFGDGKSIGNKKTDPPRSAKAKQPSLTRVGSFFWRTISIL
ncbi:hypothetical protein BFP75_07815 [Maribacter sp. 4G9]|nr:hypothetical protein BFP75_07815 [Maribacter sp. 4G9]